MNRHILSIVFAACAGSVMAETPVYLDPKAPIEARVEDALPIGKSSLAAFLACPLRWMSLRDSYTVDCACCFAGLYPRQTLRT